MNQILLCNRDVQRIYTVHLYIHLYLYTICINPFIFRMDLICVSHFECVVSFRSYPPLKILTFRKTKTNNLYIVPHTHTHWIFYIKSSTTNTQNTIHTQNFGKQNWVSTCNAYFNQIQIYNQQFSIIVVVAVSVFTIEIMICYCYWCLRSIVVQLNCFGWAWKPKLFDEKEEFHFSVHKLNQLKIQWKQTFTFDFEFRSMFIVCSDWTFCVLFPLQKIADNSRYYPMKRPVK